MTEIEEKSLKAQIKLAKEINDHHTQLLQELCYKSYNLLPDNLKRDEPGKHVLFTEEQYNKLQYFMNSVYSKKYDGVSNEAARLKELIDIKSTILNQL